MKFALIGQDIPSLLPALLADLFFAHREEAEAVILERNEAMRDLAERYGLAVTKRAGCGHVTATANRAEALRDADCVIYAGEPMASSRFRMDREALSGVDDDDAGLCDQARTLGGIGGLMRTLRQGDAVYDLCDAMQIQCPHALVITLGEPVGRTVEMFRSRGFTAWGLTAGWRKGAAGLLGLCGRLGAKPEDVEAVAAGLPHFTFLTALRDRKTGRSLLPILEEQTQAGENGHLAQRWLDMFGAVSVGDVGDHAALMPAQEDYEPDPEPSLSEPVEKRKERILRMNTAAEKGLRDPEGQAAQLLLLSTAPAARPVQLALALLEKRDLELDAAVRANTNRVIANLPREAIIEAPLTLKDGIEQSKGITLPGALADLCLDIDDAGRLAAHAASGDREALRECVELDPALGGLDRLYCLDAVNRMIGMHSDILSRWGEEEDD
ncbi:MAG: hypothetical protein IK127_05735 [Clostridia bacterium]|nr:hypothetical protein [Clostridia bacterium]